MAADPRDTAIWGVSLWGEPLWNGPSRGVVGNFDFTVQMDLLPFASLEMDPLPALSLQPDPLLTLELTAQRF